MNRGGGNRLFQDTDTAVLLHAIEERKSPLSWFGGDWPLENHFYRPISTLTFEFDQAVHPGSGDGFALTNALLCVGSVLLLFWFLRELCDSPILAVGGALLFAWWHLGWGQVFGLVLQVLAIVALLTCLLPGRRLLGSVIAFLALLFASVESNGIVPLAGRMLFWLPGRTASTMAVFAILALAAYARFERVGATRIPKPLGPLDPPATKGTQAVGVVSRWNWLWAALSGVSALLSMMSYEQGVMVPAALLGVAICMRWRRFQVRWAWQGLFWGALLAYLALRYQLVPADVSRYQAQQFRSGPGVAMSLLGYVFPSANGLWTLWLSRDIGAALIYGPMLWQALLDLATNLATVQVSRSAWILPLTGWALSILAYLPMAWLKEFEHYHYWPMAMRSLFVVGLLAAAGQYIISAASRPALQAPARLDPAPGSLPHR